MTTRQVNIVNEAVDIVRTFFPALQLAETTLELTVPPSIKPNLDVLLFQWEQCTCATLQSYTTPTASVMFLPISLPGTTSAGEDTASP